MKLEIVIPPVVLLLFIFTTQSCFILFVCCWFCVYVCFHIKFNIVPLRSEELCWNLDGDCVETVDYFWEDGHT